MPITLDEMIIRLETLGGDQSAQKVQRVTREVQAAGQAAQAAAPQFDASQIALLGVANAAQTAIYAVSTIAAFVAGISGIRTAAEFRDIALSLEQVTGSAKMAERMLKQLRRLGAETPFDTKELSAFAAQLIAAGTAADQAVPQLKSLADLAAFSRVPRAELPEFLRNIVQIRGQPTPELEDLKQLTRLAPGIGKIVGAGMGTGPLTSIEAMRRLQGMSGQQAFDTILRGTELIAKDAAKLAALLNPLAAFANLLENINMIMEPTGQLILPVLGKIVEKMSQLAKFLGDINLLTHGLAGLAAIILVVVKVRGMLVTSFWAAVGATQALTASLNSYAAAARGAAVSNAVGGAAQAAGAIGLGGRLKGVWGGLKAGWKGMGGIKGLGPRALGLGATAWGAAKGLGPKALTFAKSATGIGALSFGTEILGDVVGGKTGEWLKNIGSGAGWGAMVGAGLGSIIPGLGTAVGAAVGASIGGLAGAIQTFFSQRSGMGGSDAAAKKLDETNKILRGIQGNIVGGGSRTRLAVSTTEAEIALARMMNPKMGVA